jgi:hypothetical protein
MAYFVGVHVVDLPKDAVNFMRRFGHSLRGKESKRAFETRKALHKTSSDFKKTLVASKQSKLVEPFDFDLDLAP